MRNQMDKISECHNLLPNICLVIWLKDVKKAERWRIDVFELWCWRRLLRVPWTARRSNQSILKEISPGCSLEGLVLKLKLRILWPPHAKSWLFGKDPYAGRNWGQEEKGMTEDEMAGWHHQLDGHEFGWTPGIGDEQGGLAWCNSWGRRVGHDWATELNVSEGNTLLLSFSFQSFKNGLHSGVAMATCVLGALRRDLVHLPWVSKNQWPCTHLSVAGLDGPAQSGHAPTGFTGQFLSDHFSWIQCPRVSGYSVNHAVYGCRAIIWI